MGVCAQEVGEEKHLQHHEDDKQLHQNHQPERSPQRHVSESVVVEVPDSVKEVSVVHGIRLFRILLQK